MKVVILATLVAAAVAVAPTYPAPAHYPAPAYKAPAYDNHPHPYDFGYQVKDEYTYNNFGHAETSDGKGYVKGQYNVALPDGRHQTVTYTADDYNGYVADVKYAGDAKHPSYAPVPAYKPAYAAPKY